MKAAGVIMRTRGCEECQRSSDTIEIPFNREEFPKMKYHAWIGRLKNSTAALAWMAKSRVLIVLKPMKK